MTEQYAQQQEMQVAYTLHDFCDITLTGSMPMLLVKMKKDYPMVYAELLDNLDAIEDEYC